MLYELFAGKGEIAHGMVVLSAYLLKHARLCCMRLAFGHSCYSNYLVYLNHLKKELNPLDRDYRLSVSNAYYLLAGNQTEYNV